MRRQVGFVRKTLLTNGTNVWFFARVCLQVTFKVVLPVEPSFTYATLVRLLSRMHQEVPLQFRVVRETFAANMAFERLFASMSHQMLLESVQIAERLCA